MTFEIYICAWEQFPRIVWISIHTILLYYIDCGRDNSLRKGGHLAQKKKIVMLKVYWFKESQNRWLRLETSVEDFCNTAKLYLTIKELKIGKESLWNGPRYRFVTFELRFQRHKYGKRWHLWQFLWSELIKLCWQ